MGLPMKDGMEVPLLQAFSAQSYKLHRKNIYFSVIISKLFCDKKIIYPRRRRRRGYNYCKFLYRLI
jgi:hypothetical protein